MNDPERQCTAKSKTTGGRCKQPAVAGGTVCRFHGGRAPQVRAKAARRLALAEAGAELRRLGELPDGDVDPTEAMISTVTEAAANVAVYRHLVQQLEHHGVVLGQADTDDDGLGRVVLGGSIAGPTGSTAKLFDAAPHVFVTMYDAERERLMKWAKMCRDAGVDERRVEVAEEQGRQLAEVLKAFAALVVARLRIAAPGAVAGLEAAIPELLTTAVRSVIDIEAA